MPRWLICAELVFRQIPSPAFQAPADDELIYFLIESSNPTGFKRGILVLVTKIVNSLLGWDFEKHSYLEKQLYIIYNYNIYQRGDVPLREGGVIDLRAAGGGNGKSVSKFSLPSPHVFLLSQNRICCW